MPRATWIYKNGTILTMDEASPRAEAIAVGRDGRILAVGSESEVGSLANRDTRTIDLRGRTLMPGFFDCHLHLTWLGINLGHVDLSSPPVADVEDIVRLLRARLAANPDLTCVQGNRYDQNRLPNALHPTRHDLDRVATDVPVRIVHTSGHAAVVNTRALQMLGITRDTPDPIGGEIERGPDGEPTGVLLETASWAHLERILPHVTTAESVEALGRANGYLLQRGITSATDANTPPAERDIFRRAVTGGILQTRTNLMIGWAEVVEQAGEGAIPTPQEFTFEGIDWHDLHVGQAKLFSDGAITTRTCWLTEPFRNMPDNYGIPIHPPEELRELIRLAHNAGWQIATHAIGDRAVDEVLTAYAEAQREHTRPKPGHRIEHCMLLDAGLIARLRRQNVWSIGQPEFLSRLGDAYVLALDEERANRLSPYATLDRQNVAQAFSSDCPVVPGAPLDGIRAAMERKTVSGRLLNAKECLSAEAALYACTSAPAYASRADRDRGTLEIGKFADFVVLTADPTAVPVSEWEQVQVAATIIGGECRFGEATLD
ncbi:MAG: putative metal-dependent hydrolase with the TIM-barrel fold [Chthonomonadaceae bacterium]|nr:putative metal-dependent hydrolase with the TIM-barrel fold [Chthonomonadaceae bacterium]